MDAAHTLKLQVSITAQQARKLKSKQSLLPKPELYLFQNDC
jgi:hypothetical protein